MLSPFYIDQQAYRINSFIQKIQLTHVLLPSLYKACPGGRMILTHRDLCFYTLRFHTNKVSRLLYGTSYRCTMVQTYTCNHFHFHFIGNIWLCQLPPIKAWWLPMCRIFSFGNHCLYSVWEVIQLMQYIALCLANRKVFWHIKSIFCLIKCEYNMKCMVGINICSHPLNLQVSFHCQKIPKKIDWPDLLKWKISPHYTEEVAHSSEFSLP